MKPLELKSCSSCRASFTCGPETGAKRCWCDQLPHVGVVTNADEDCLCPQCLREAQHKLNTANCSGASLTVTDVARERNVISPSPLIEGEDYYSEGPAIVFTARYHLRRGYCCDNNCRHCPFGE